MIKQLTLNGILSTEKKRENCLGKSLLYFHLLIDDVMNGKPKARITKQVITRETWNIIILDDVT